MSSPPSGCNPAGVLWAIHISPECVEEARHLSKTGLRALPGALKALLSQGEVSRGEVQLALVFPLSRVPTPMGPSFPVGWAGAAALRAFTRETAVELRNLSLEVEEHWASQARGQQRAQGGKRTETFLHASRSSAVSESSSSPSSSSRVPSSPAQRNGGQGAGAGEESGEGGAAAAAAGAATVGLLALLPVSTRVQVHEREECALAEAARDLGASCLVLCDPEPRLEALCSARLREQAPGCALLVLGGARPVALGKACPPPNEGISNGQDQEVSPRKGASMQSAPGVHQRKGVSGAGSSEPGVQRRAIRKRKKGPPIWVVVALLLGVLVVSLVPLYWMLSVLE